MILLKRQDGHYYMVYEWHDGSSSEKKVTKESTSSGHKYVVTGDNVDAEDGVYYLVSSDNSMAVYDKNGLINDELYYVEQTTQATTDKEPKNDRCIPVPPRLVALISEKLEPETARAVKSNDFQNIYFIAAKDKEMGLEGLWTSNVIEAKSGMILAANDIALELASWPDARNGQMKISEEDDGYSQALKCLSK